MPASRSARAITLAPRSCPSSPGFATSTRILLSAIAIHLTTSGNPPAGLGSKGLDVQAPPHIPASHAAVGSPGFRDFLHIFWLGKFAFLVVLAHGHLDAIIAGGQNVRTAQGKHQKHVGGPHANALYLGEMPDDFF